MYIYLCGLLISLINKKAELLVKKLILQKICKKYNYFQKKMNLLLLNYI